MSPTACFLKAKEACVLHHTHACLLHYLMIAMPRLIKILSKGYGDNVRNKFSKVFLRISIPKCFRSKEWVLITMITLHHLFFFQCVNLEVIVWEETAHIFIQKLCSLSKYLGPKQSPSNSHFEKYT